MYNLSVHVAEKAIVVTVSPQFRISREGRLQRLHQTTALARSVHVVSISHKTTVISEMKTWRWQTVTRGYLLQPPGVAGVAL